MQVPAFTPPMLFVGLSCVALVMLSLFIASRVGNATFAVAIFVVNIGVGIFGFNLLQQWSTPENRAIDASVVKWYGLRVPDDSFQFNKNSPRTNDVFLTVDGESKSCAVWFEKKPINWTAPTQELPAKLVCGGKEPRLITDPAPALPKSSTATTKS